MKPTRPLRADVRPSDAMLEALLAHATGAVFIGRPDGTLVRANRAACALMRASEEQLRALGRSGIVQSTPGFDALLAERARNTSAWGEFVFRRPDGTTFPVELSTTMVALPDLGPVVIISFRDVSEQRAAARALAQSDERARLALDAAQLGTWQQDLRTRAITFDARGAEHFDVPVGTVRLEDLLARVDAADRDRVARAIDAGLHPAGGARPHEIECRVIRRDGSVRWIAVLASAQFEAEGAAHPVSAIGTTRDVTERKEREEALRASEEALRLAQDAARMGSWSHDLASGHVVCSARAKGMLGLAPDAPLVFGDFFAAIHPDDREQVHHAICASIETGTALEFEARVRWPDGTVRWISSSGRPSYDEAGRPVRMTGMAVDVTERRVAEEAAREAAEKLRVAFDTFRDGIVITRARDGRVDSVSQGFARIFGRPVEELVGRTTLELGLWPDLDARARFVDALARDGAILDFRTSMRRADGTLITTETSAQAFTVAGERYIFGVTRDVTERMRADDERRLLAAAVEQTPASIVVTDDAGIVQFVNPAFERVSGCSRDEVIGRPASLGCNEAHGEGLSREIWRRVRAGEVWKGRLASRSRSGHVFTEDAVVAPVRDADGRIANYVAVKRDVTEELALQEALSQAQRLESVGRLAGGVAHDFNNVLTVILSCAEELQRELAGAAPLVREDVDEIRGAAERARDLTAQLLAVARQQVIAPVPLDLNDVVRGSARLLRRVIGEDVELAVVAARGLWTVRCDPGQLDQILMNVAVNARDAMPRGGRLEIETSNFVATVSNRPLYRNVPPGEYVRLAVRDDGCGMTAEVMNRIFEPFFTTKAAGKGTGLGLATVYGIVKQSEGHVCVESEPGRGTTIEILFPRADARPVQAAGATASGARGGDEAVLLVEDDEQVREVGARALRGAGYGVVATQTAADALAVAERTHFDLLVTDVVMPGLDGAQLAQQLTARQPALRVLFLSGYAESSIAHQGRLDDGVQLLSKPFTRTMLLARVRALLDARA